MPKHVATAIAACLYVALSAWLVGAVGKAHRDGLKPAVSQTTTRPEPSREAVIAEKTASKAPPPDLAPSRTLTPTPAKSPEALASANPVPPVAAPDLRSPPPALKPKPAENDAAKRSAADAAKPKGPFLDLEPLDPFFASLKAKKRWLLPLNTGDEIALGSDLRDMVLHFNRRVADGTLERRLYDAADPLRKNVSRKDIKYRFSVLDSKAINAFSHPGGFVYVTSGLLEWIGEDEDYLIKFALAHEIYHVDQGHALKCLQDSGFQKMPYGTLPLFYLFLFPKGYWPEEMDFKADAWAVRQLSILGHNRRECLLFLDKLDGYEALQGSIEGHLPPLPGDIASLFDNHYRAHPAARERLKRARALFEETPAGKPR